MVAARVAVYAARPGRHSSDGEVQRGLMLEDAGVVEPIDDRRVGFDASHQAVEPGESVLECDGEDSEEVVREIEAHAARDHDASEEAIAGEPLVHLLEALLQAHPGGGAVVERGAGADVADVADVVVEPLQLESDATDEPGPRRGVDVGNLLECLTVTQAVRDRADPTDTLGDVKRIERREPLHPLFQPAMRVEQARVEIEHGLADRRKAKVTRFDDAGVDRADRDLEDALAFGDEVRKLIGGLDRDPLRSVESLAEREYALWPPVVDHERAGIGMADR